MSYTSKLIKTDILGYLQQQQHKDILRFLTCGNVDDGKSTLIGRLLHDSKMIFDDQLASIKRDSKKFNTTNEELDLALLVDGLQAEREQGITIDVAYRYFSTDKRKFIIADCPGHEEYTRNMATGASHCELAIILIDASKGMQTQTKRHSYIVNLLGIKKVILAINKMDLMGFDQAVFSQIKQDYLSFADKLDFDECYFIPLSALKGDNVVKSSHHMPWYFGAPLMETLENIALNNIDTSKIFRLPIQYVNRLNPNFRGFCGTVASGNIQQGDNIIALPSGRQSRVKAIITADGELQRAIKGQAITLTLEDEIDISRGDMLVSDNHAAKVTDTITAELIWMSATPLTVGRPYLFKVGGQSICGQISCINHRMDINSLTPHAADLLQLNEVASVTISLHQPRIFSTYQQCRTTGGFIMINRLTNATVAAGMIETLLDSQVGTETDNIAAMSYAERLAAFNAEVSLLVQKYFPE